MINKLDSTLNALRSATLNFTPPTAAVGTPLDNGSVPRRNHRGSVPPHSSPQPTICFVPSPPPSPCPQPHWPELQVEAISDEEEPAEPAYPLARAPVGGLGWEMLWRQGFRGGGVGKISKGAWNP